MPDGNDDILRIIDDALAYKPAKLDVPSVIDDELGRLGYSDNARLAILGNTGRENSWDGATIFNGHRDPKNQGYNRGIISWQGRRQADLNMFLKQNGGDWTPNENNLRLQTRFLDQELRTKYPRIYKTLTDPGASLPRISRSLRSYISYVPGAPYNTLDSEYDVRNNRIWAEKAKQRGLGAFDLQGALDTVDDALADHDTYKAIDDALKTYDAAKGSRPAGNDPESTPPSPTFRGPILPLSTSQQVMQPAVKSNTPTTEETVPTQLSQNNADLTSQIDQLTAIGQAARQGQAYSALPTSTISRQTAAPRYTDADFTRWVNENGYPKTEMSKAAFEAKLRNHAILDEAPPTLATQPVPRGSRRISRI